MPITTVPVDPHFNFHFANAYESAQGEIVFDVVWADRMELGADVSDTVPIWETVDFGKQGVGVVRPSFHVPFFALIAPFSSFPRAPCPVPRAPCPVPLAQCRFPP